MKRDPPVTSRAPSPSEARGGRWQQEAREGPGGAQAPQQSSDYRDLSLPPPAPTLIKSFFPLLESPLALSAGVGATAGSCRQPHEKWGWEGRREAATRAWPISSLEGPPAGGLTGGALIRGKAREGLDGPDLASRPPDPPTATQALPLPLPFSFFQPRKLGQLRSRMPGF